MVHRAMTMGEDAVPLFCPSNSGTNKLVQKICCGFIWPPANDFKQKANQINVGAIGEGQDRTHDHWGTQGWVSI